MKRSIKKTALLASMALLTASPLFAAEKITIAGDPCSLPLIQKVVEAYKEKIDNKLEVEFTKVGCMMGVYQAANQKYDIGVSTQNGLSTNLPKGASLRVVGKAPIVLLVNKANPLTDITYEQLQGIFSGEITNWKEVGGKDLAIKNVMLEPCVKHTMSKKVIPYGQELAQLKPDKKVNPVAHTNTMVSENDGAIGQQLYGYETSDVKVLTVDGVTATEENLKSGKYTFFEEYNIVTRGEPTGTIGKLIDFASGPEGEKVMRAMKHVPQAS